MTSTLPSRHLRALESNSSRRPIQQPRESRPRRVGGALCSRARTERTSRFAVEIEPRPQSGGNLLHCAIKSYSGKLRDSRLSDIERALARISPPTCTEDLRSASTLSEQRYTAVMALPCATDDQAQGSFALDVRRLDDRPPLLDLGFLQCAERLRGLLLARRDFEAEHRHALAHARIRHG